ncbi:MAG: 5'/3'-nucleotidase SurE [Bdellovibrionales bacterium]|nr:5'/3'-nucleotidase SurE [Bdellovibrionales bacterium]
MALWLSMTHVAPPSVLLTNDDGIDSPLFHALLERVSAAPWQLSTTFVVPAEEHSWIAQAATPKRPVYVTPFVRSGTSGWICSGTPADCVSLGIDNLTETRPELVISGINIGVNTGLAYYLSSGTVGAARQAVITGVKATALSVHVPPEVFGAWARHDLELLANYSNDWQRLGTIAAGITGKLIQAKAWQGADLLSVNLPWDADESTQVAVTELQRTHYRPLFTQRSSRTFIHRPIGLQEVDADARDEQRLLGDCEALRQGLISVTPIRYELRPRDNKYLERVVRALAD